MSTECSDFLKHVPAEYDLKVREAQFYLYTRPIKDLVLSHSNDKEMHHWILVAIFEDKSVRALEGFNDDGKFIPVFLKEKPLNERDLKVFELLPIKTSPDELQRVAKSNELNGKDYDMINNNCQNWVKAAAKAVSLDLAEAVENHKTAGELPPHKLAALYLSAGTNSSKDLCSKTCSEPSA
uniref:Uncharacterized protein n=1 Tax=Rhodnius prolixus TaxID=13249 RepID=T1HT67_RHOPR